MSLYFLFDFFFFLDPLLCDGRTITLPELEECELDELESESEESEESEELDEEEEEELDDGGSGGVDEPPPPRPEPPTKGFSTFLLIRKARARLLSDPKRCDNGVCGASREYFLTFLAP